MHPQAGSGWAQVRATVTAKSRRGQARKHHIWYALARYHLILHTQCSKCAVDGWGRGRKGESREPNKGSAMADGKQIFNADLMRILSYRTPSQWRRSSRRGSRRPAGGIERRGPGRGRADRSSEGQAAFTSLPAFRRTHRWTQSHDKNSGGEISRWGRAGCRRASRSPS